MGSWTDASIAAFQEETGIKPATGDYDEALGRISRAAFEMIKIIEHERSGIRSGDGYWRGSDVISGTFREMAVRMKSALEARYRDRYGADKARKAASVVFEDL